MLAERVTIVPFVAIKHHWLEAALLVVGGGRFFPCPGTRERGAHGQEAWGEEGERESAFHKKNKMTILEERRGAQTYDQNQGRL